MLWEEAEGGVKCIQKEVLIFVGPIDKPLTAYLVDRDYYPWIQHDNLPLLWIPNLPTDLLTTLSAVDVDSRLHVGTVVNVYYPDINKFHI